MTKVKILVTGLLTVVALHAQTGAEVYEAHCAVCHQIAPSGDKSKLMSATTKNRVSMKAEMVAKMKAPHMNKVSAKIKFDFKNDKTAFLAFVKDYIVNPSKDKSHCMPMAITMFGVMPPIGKGMNAKDIESVANWLYDNFTEQWDPNGIDMLCKAKGVKSVENKSSTNKNTFKTAPKTMKCGQGKCGGNK